MYKCTVCGNIISHIHNSECLPCSECSQFSWEIINKDKDYLLSTHQTNSVHIEFN